VTRIVVVAPLRPGTRDAVREFVESGPPFDLGATQLGYHSVHLTAHEAVFVFEGPDARRDVEKLLGEPSVWRTAGAWRDWLAGRPRLANEVFGWSREKPDLS